MELPVAQRKLTIEMSEESYQKWIEYKGKHVAKRFTDEALFLFMMTEAEKEKVLRSYTREAPPLDSKSPRFISASTRRQLLKSANNKCQSPRCQSTYGLEVDHVRPVSRGGGNHISNLQILCRHHNAAKG